jgi:hypothetical protein
MTLRLPYAWIDCVFVNSEAPFRFWLLDDERIEGPQHHVSSSRETKPKAAAMPYDEIRGRLIAHLEARVATGDWRGVSDAANELRELEAKRHGVLVYRQERAREEEEVRRIFESTMR